MLPGNNPRIQVLKANLWDLHNEGKTCAITTNGFVKANGECVMGRGVALQAKQRYPEFPRMLGEKLKAGNIPYFFPEYNLYSFPTKHKWWQKSDLTFIRSSLCFMQCMMQHPDQNIKHIYLPKPGCDNGGLSWETEVEPILRDVIDPKLVTIIDDKG